MTQGLLVEDFLRATDAFDNDREERDLTVAQILEVEEFFGIFIPASVLV